MKTTAFAAAFLILSTASAFAADLPGKYKVDGTNADGSTYSGTAEIVATSEVTCRIKWKTGSTSSEGICMRNGNSFAAGYVLGKEIGLVVYEIMDDGTLDGVWTIADSEGVGKEVLTPMK
jgi:hypothetical protein